MTDAKEIWHTPPPITRRDLDFMPRCSCKSEDLLRPGNPPVFHPRHEPGRCIVMMDGGEMCPCEG